MSTIANHAMAAPATSVDQLFENSVTSPVVSLINDSEKSIDIEIYTMKDLGVIKALKAAITRKVKLRIIQTDNMLDPCRVFDPVTSGEDATCVTLKKFVPYVNKAGGTYVPFNKQLCATPGSNCFEHGKILISDKKKALISTGNFDPSNLCDLSESPTNCNRDFTYVTTDSSVISEMNTIFENDLTGVTYDLERIIQSAPKNRLTVSPYSLDPLVAFIKSAKKTIQIENQYLKDPTLNQALIDAAKSGVNVFVMVESVTAFQKLDPKDPKDVNAISKWTENYSAFDRAGIKTKVFNASIKINGMPGYLHAKAILVDSKHAWVGSVNGSTESLTENREYGLFSDDPAVVKSLGTVLYADFLNPNAETWKDSLASKKDRASASAPGSNGDDGSSEECE